MLTFACSYHTSTQLSPLRRLHAAALFHIHTRPRHSHKPHHQGNAAPSAQITKLSTMTAPSRRLLPPALRKTSLLHPHHNHLTAPSDNVLGAPTQLSTYTTTQLMKRFYTLFLLLFTFTFSIVAQDFGNTISDVLKPPMNPNWVNDTYYGTYTVTKNGMGYHFNKIQENRSANPKYFRFDKGQNSYIWNTKDDLPSSQPYDITRDAYYLTSISCTWASTNTGKRLAVYVNDIPWHAANDEIGHFVGYLTPQNAILEVNFGMNRWFTVTDPDGDTTNDDEITQFSIGYSNTPKVCNLEITNVVNTRRIYECPMVKATTGSHAPDGYVERCRLALTFDVTNTGTSVTEPTPLEFDIFQPNNTGNCYWNSKETLRRHHDFATIEIPPLQPGDVYHVTYDGDPQGTTVQRPIKGYYPGDSDDGGLLITTGINTLYAGPITVYAYPTNGPQMTTVNSVPLNGSENNPISDVSVPLQLRMLESTSPYGGNLKCNIYSTSDCIVGTRIGEAYIRDVTIFGNRDYSYSFTNFATVTQNASGTDVIDNDTPLLLEKGHTYGYKFLRTDAVGTEVDLKEYNNTSNTYSAKTFSFTTASAAVARVELLNVVPWVGDDSHPTTGSWVRTDEPLVVHATFKNIGDADYSGNLECILCAGLEGYNSSTAFALRVGTEDNPWNLDANEQKTVNFDFKNLFEQYSSADYTYTYTAEGDTQIQTPCGIKIPNGAVSYFTNGNLVPARAYNISFWYKENYNTAVYGPDNLTAFNFYTDSLLGPLTGIEDVQSAQEGEAEMWSLQGVRVNPMNAAPGIYIVRQGAKTSKVVIR